MAPSIVMCIYAGKFRITQRPDFPFISYCNLVLIRRFDRTNNESQSCHLALGHFKL